MPQETLGYVEMEWTCQRCGTKNPGLQKTCQNCGAAMDANQKFEQAAEQKLITDEDKVAQAKKGADIHCPYCGTRNAADAKVCSQCGGDLTKAEKRAAGQVVGAFSDRPAAKVACPACGTENLATAANCVNCGHPLGATQPVAAPAATPSVPAAAPKKTPVWIAVAGGLIGLLCLGAVALFAFQLFNTTDVVATVQAVHWERSIGIEARVPVERKDWRDEIPTGAEIGVCELKEREKSEAPDPSRRSDKICGTPYTVDLGNGVSEVRQDCEYQIFDDYCPYTVLEWKEVDRAVARGDDLAPQWPQLSLRPEQREGERRETYTVAFDSGGETYDYSVADEAEFAQFAPGSRWTLQVNGLGGVNSAEPAR